MATRQENWQSFASRLQFQTLSPTQIQEIAAQEHISRSVASALKWAGLYDGIGAFTGKLSGALSEVTPKKAAAIMMKALSDYNRFNNERRAKTSQSRIEDKVKQLKDETVIFRLTAEEKEMIKEYADLNQVSMSRAIVNAVQWAASPLTDESCILYLKSRGYKVYKIVEQEV